MHSQTPEAKDVKGKPIFLRSHVFWILLVITTLLFCYGVARSYLQPGGITGEWVWGRRSLDVIYTASRFKFPIGVFLISLFACGFLVKLFHFRRVGRKMEVFSLIVALILSFLIQTSVFSLGKYGFTDLPLIMVNDSQTSYLFDMVKIQDMGQFLRDFPSVSTGLTVHSSTHPPGAILFFWLVKSIIGKCVFLQGAMFGLGNYLGIDFPYLASVDLLLRDPSVYATSLFSGSLILFLTTLTVFPLYYLGKEYYNQRVGLYAALLFLFVPSVILFTPQMDQIFALFAVGIILWFYIGLKRRNLWWIFFSSVLFSFSLFFSFAFLGLLPMGCCLLAMDTINKKDEKTGSNFDFQFVGLVSIVFLLPLLAFYASAKMAFHLDMIEVFGAVMAPVNECISQRSYSKWLLYNLYDFFSFLGIPLFLLFARKLILEIKSFAQRENRNRDILFYSLIFTIFVLEMLGKNRGEVARLWLFLMPFAVLVCASTLDTVISRSTGDGKRTSSFRGVLFSISLILCLQFTQTVVFKVFLETIGIPGLPSYEEFVRLLANYV